MGGELICVLEVKFGKIVSSIFLIELLPVAL